MKLFGLTGYPLEHSFSRNYFTEKFRREGIGASYECFEVPCAEALPELLRAHPFTGLNVTIPYKERIIPFLDELDETAAAIGAVNVIHFLRHGDTVVKKGFNTDVIGFSASIAPWLRPHHRGALILGTGGASKAIDYGLRQLGLSTTFVSRMPAAGRLTYADLSEAVMAAHTVVVNTTPLGMFPHTEACPPIPYPMLTEAHLLFDAIYNPSETVFLKKGRARGATTLNGQEMLIGQAEAAWKIWTAADGANDTTINPQ